MGPVLQRGMQLDAIYQELTDCEQVLMAVRTEYACSLREIVMMESLNDWKLGNLVQFG